MKEVQEAKDYLLDTISRTLSPKLDEPIEKTCEWILKARKVFVYGVGRSGLIGQAFAIRLIQLGLDVHFIGEVTTPIVEKGDLTIIVSNTGQTMSAVQTANIARREGVAVIAITSKASSKLGHAANIIIPVEVPKGIEERKDLAPLGTIFEDATLVLFDMMVVRLMKQLDRDEKSMRSRHSIWV